ncbi:MAG: c-type cytochrome [Comamonadaceae bacterium]|nr:MAG: c-type cytochrome [Comamonadaceae bacterium]
MKHIVTPSNTPARKHWKAGLLAAAACALIGVASLPLSGIAQPGGAVPTPQAAPAAAASAPAAPATPAAIAVTSVPPSTPALSPTVAAFSTMAPPRTTTPAADAQVVRGEYLARAGDCISCHTRAGGVPFAGGLSMSTPFGAIVSTNITPDKSQGIGNYTQADFTQALREGKSKDGRHLYPAMPYTNFSKLGDEDLSALYVYFMKGVKPATQDNAKTDLPWPFSMRWLMAGWNLLYLPGKPFASETSQSAEWNRGAYLVQGLGHCGACHTPRSVTGAEKAATHADGELFLSGAVIDGWYAQPLRNSTAPGLGTWSEAELVTYLKTGRTEKTAAFGAMRDVITNSTQHLSDADLKSVAVYLKSLNGKDGGTAPVTPAPAGGASGGAVAAALQKGDVGRIGSLVYLNNCNACHRSDGQGAQKTFPTLAQNSVVNAKDPTSLIRLVLEGSVMPQTQQAPSPIGMPGFGWRLTDANVADVLTLVRSSWGNTGAAVTPQQVAAVRKATATDAPSAQANMAKPWTGK